MKYITFFLLLMTLCLKVISQSSHPFTAGIFYDQDYTLEMIGLDKLNEDRNYTMGLGFYYSDPALKRWFVFKPLYWINRLAGDFIL